MAVGKGIPHDLGQYVIEAATGYGHGFWGAPVARGATFKSTGRRPTRPGPSPTRTHRGDLLGAEHLAGLHLALWKANQNDAVSGALDSGLRTVAGIADGRASRLPLAFRKGKHRVLQRGQRLKACPTSDLNEEEAMRVTGIVANLPAADIAAARDFYTDYLGLSVEDFNLGWVARSSDHPTAGPRFSS